MRGAALKVALSALESEIPTAKFGLFLHQVCV